MVEKEVIKGNEKLCLRCDGHNGSSVLCSLRAHKTGQLRDDFCIWHPDPIWVIGKKDKTSTLEVSNQQITHSFITAGKIQNRKLFLITKTTKYPFSIVNIASRAIRVSDTQWRKIRFFFALIKIVPYWEMP